MDLGGVMEKMFEITFFAYTQHIVYTVGLSCLQDVMRK